MENPKSEDEKRRDDILKRMLATKPTPKKPETKLKPVSEKKRGPATKPSLKR